MTVQTAADVLRIVMAAGTLHLAAPQAVRPVASLSVKCTGRQCTFDGSKSTGATRYVFRWGTAQQDEVRTAPAAPVAVNTFAAGTYCVRLTVKNAAGDSSYTTRQLTLPMPVPAPVLKACPKSVTPPPVPPPGKVDTVIRYLPGRVDTVLRVRVDTVKSVRIDTLRLAGRTDTLRLPARTDTLFLPGKVDTLLRTRIDTVKIAGRVDTVQTGSVLPPNVVIVPNYGENQVWWNGQVVGRLIFLSTTNETQAMQASRCTAMRSIGTYPTQREAIIALLYAPTQPC